MENALKTMPIAASLWADRIRTAWQSSFEGIIECGRLLIAAKEELGHGEWMKLIETELPFKKSTSAALMRIAADERLVKLQHVGILPPHWGTLAELTRLPDDVFQAKIDDGTIRPEMQRKDVAKENRLISKARDEMRVRALVPRMGRFRTLVIDPPWDYEWLSIAGRASPGYATMTHAQLLALDVAQWAEDNCHLYLWTTNNFMTRAVELMARWGFQHKTVLTWVKPRWGLGSYFRNSTEHVLFGVRGELRTRSDSIATHFEAPVTEHSAKPPIFYDIVRKASYELYGEIFQREGRADFTNLFSEMSEAAE
jgi:N6-adenosine-specific RNA methylase IME4